MLSKFFLKLTLHSVYEHYIQAVYEHRAQIPNHYISNLQSKDWS